MNLNEDILLNAIRDGAWDNYCINDRESERRQAKCILDSMREAIVRQPELLEELRPK